MPTKKSKHPLVLLDTLGAKAREVRLLVPYSNSSVP